MAKYYDLSLCSELNRLANGGATYRSPDQMVGEDLAANQWAGTSGLSLLGALNAKNSSSGLGLNLVCNQLAGTSGLEARDALAQRAS